MNLLLDLFGQKFFTNTSSRLLCIVEGQAKYHKKRIRCACTTIAMVDTSSSFIKANAKHIS